MKSLPEISADLQRIAMNVPTGNIGVVGHEFDTLPLAYKYGHRDARHAIVQLILTYSSDLSPAGAGDDAEDLDLKADVFALECILEQKNVAMDAANDNGGILDEDLWASMKKARDAAVSKLEKIKAVLAQADYANGCDVTRKQKLKDIAAIVNERTA